MDTSAVPLRFKKYWSQNADPAFVRTPPVDSQIGITDGAASYADGFPPLTFLPIDAGGIPPFGADMNGAVRAVTQWLQWMQAGGVVAAYDAAFASAIGGYPAGARVASAVVSAKTYISTVNNNLSDPDSLGATGWTNLPSEVSTGDVVWSMKATVPFGYVPLDTDVSIGNAVSGATYASPENKLLYRYTWLQFSNSRCAVTGGRGANPDADFNAGKTISLINMAGCAPISYPSGLNYLDGVPVNIGNANLLGSLIGENFHVNTLAEIPATTPTGTIAVFISDPTHAHLFPGNTVQVIGGNESGGGRPIPGTLATQAAATGITATASFAGDSNGGGGQKHNTVQFSMIGRFFQKL